MNTSPADARPRTRHLRLGLAYFKAKRFADAIDAYRQGILDIEANPGATASKDLADLYTALGNAALAGGDLATAVASYEAAHRLHPESTDCLCGLAHARLKQGQPREAIALCRLILARDPSHWLARINLAQAYRVIQDYEAAKILLSEMASERPEDALAPNQLGKLHYERDELPAAHAWFELAHVLRPQDADSLYWLGSVRLAMGDTAGAEADYRRAARLQPLINLPAKVFPSRLTVLILFSPMSGNTPIQYVLKQSVYEANIILALPGMDYDVACLHDSGDLVFNLISEADRSQTLLPWAADLVDRLGKPTINHPRNVRRTTREGTTHLLQSIDGCRLPRIARLPAGAGVCAKSCATSLEAMLPASLPVLARPVGTHGGDDFEKFDSLDELVAFLNRRPAIDHYLIEYIDYSSPDGYFRKYRCIFVDDQIFPYHLAIGTDWKVHHISTDMINQDWMQAEEKSFLENPAVSLTPANISALHAIRRAVGLDYFGIDFGLNLAGALVVFEVNASMLVHERADFPYAAPFVHRIKSAFDDMVWARATQPKAGAKVAFSEPTRDE